LEAVPMAQQGGTTRLAGVLGIRPQASLAEELADYWSWFNQASLVP
jgi:hypothetical protein